MLWGATALVCCKGGCKPAAPAPARSAVFVSKVGAFLKGVMILLIKLGNNAGSVRQCAQGCCLQWDM